MKTILTVTAMLVCMMATAQDFPSIKISGYKVDGISNDSTIANKSATKLISEWAAKQAILGRYNSLSLNFANYLSATSFNNAINGSALQVPYFRSGGHSLGGNAGFTYDTINNTLTVGGNGLAASFTGSVNISKSLTTGSNHNQNLAGDNIAIGYNNGTSYVNLGKVENNNSNYFNWVGNTWKTYWTANDNAGYDAGKVFAEIYQGKIKITNGLSGTFSSSLTAPVISSGANTTADYKICNYDNGAAYIQNVWFNNSAVQVGGDAWGANPHGAMSFQTGSNYGLHLGTYGTSHDIWLDAPNTKVSNNLYAGAFKKNGSSDSYVLLGGGGHAPLSSLGGGWSKNLNSIGDHNEAFADHYEYNIKDNPEDNYKWWKVDPMHHFTGQGDFENHYSEAYITTDFQTLIAQGQDMALGDYQNTINETWLKINSNDRNVRAIVDGAPLLEIYSPSDGDTWLGDKNEAWNGGYIHFDQDQNANLQGGRETKVGDLRKNFNEWFLKINSEYEFVTLGKNNDVTNSEGSMAIGQNNQITSGAFGYILGSDDVLEGNDENYIVGRNNLIGGSVDNTYIFGYGNEARNEASDMMLIGFGLTAESDVIQVGYGADALKIKNDGSIKTSEGFEWLKILGRYTPYTTPSQVDWLKIKIEGTIYYIPLHQN